MKYMRNELKIISGYFEYQESSRKLFIVGNEVALEAHLQNYRQSQ
jgi:hypothetical protein